MAQTSGFFEAEWDDELYNEETQSLGDWDRKYLAEEFARYFKYFVPNGVMNDPVDQLKVTAGEGMKVIVSSGFAFINGYWFYNSEQLELDVPLNETPSARVDSVRIRWNATYRTIECIYVVNDIANVRSDTYYDLQLAQVTVGASASVISDANITDVRDNKELCGLINIILADDIGDIGDLTTTNKTNIVSAINSIVSILGDPSYFPPDLHASTFLAAISNAYTLLSLAIGDIDSVHASDKTDVVSAINTVNWHTIKVKPFDKIDSDDFDIVDEGTTIYGNPVTRLIIKPKVISWSDVASKPFEAIDENTLSVVTVNNVQKLTVNHSNDDFVIASQTFTFTNLQCRINDTRITANSLADVYFTSETFENARKAKVSVETYNGYLVLTAENAPVGTIAGTIRIRVV